MSELHLSDELVNDLQNIIRNYDARAGDGGIVVQYLAAVVGYMVGQQDADYSDKSDYLHHLFDFAQEVFDDVSPPPQDAVGAWADGEEE